MSISTALELLQRAGVDVAIHPPTREQIKEAEKLAAQAGQEPLTLAVEVFRGRMELKEARRLCANSAEAAAELEAMLKKLLTGQGQHLHLETLRHEPDGVWAVCRTGNGDLRDFPVHPSIDLAALATLKPWEYVRVHEGAVVGTWRDDPHLLTMAQGEVVLFTGWHDAAQHLVRIGRPGGAQEPALLDPSLWDETFTAHTRLVLKRDDPRHAIAIAQGEQTESKFEVPVSQLETRLQDLAGMDAIAEQLLENILLRVLYTSIRNQFTLDPLRGIILSSRKPGMGKTAFVRASVHELSQLGEQMSYDVALYLVQPNQLKSLWHGEDARLVREELWGKIRERQAMPRTRPLLQILVMDEIDSLGKRSGSEQNVASSAHSDAVEAMLAEMDGILQPKSSDGPPAYVVCIGMTNRPDRIDDAIKRPGRMGDMFLEMPDPDLEAAEEIMAIYARGEELPWHLHGEIRTGLDPAEVREHFLRPALANIYPAVTVQYKTDTQRIVGVTAGQLLASVHYKEAMNAAKSRAAARKMHQEGVPAVCFGDVAEGLLEAAHKAARQMAADPGSLVRQLDIKVPVASVSAVPRHELEEHRYLRVHSA